MRNTPVALAILAIFALHGCVAMPWQIERMKTASAKWQECFNSQVDNSTSNYGDIDLILEHATAACSRMRDGYQQTIAPLGYSMEQAQKETERVESGLVRLARLKIMKRNADLGGARTDGPAPMEKR